MYARMHEGGPLHLLDVDGQWGAWAIFSHAECSSIAKDPRLSAKRAQQMLALLPPDSQSEFTRTGANAELVADIHGRAGAHPAAQTAQ